MEFSNTYAEKFVISSLRGRTSISGEFNFAVYADT